MRFDNWKKLTQKIYELKSHVKCQNWTYNIVKTNYKDLKTATECKNWTDNLLAKASDLVRT